MDPGPGRHQSRRRVAVVRAIASPFGVLLLCVGVAWTVELIDSVVLGDRLQAYGVGPRRIEGLTGVVLAPLLHSGWGHVASNSLPFLALGWLVLLRGRRYWMLVSVGAALGGGALTWLLAGGMNHIGASGVVFGYFGALLAGAFYDRRPALLAPALVALFVYGSMLAGLVPQEAISWEGHLFGLVAGAAMARVLATPPDPPPTGDPDEPHYPWEIDEPWLDPEP